MSTGRRRGSDLAIRLLLRLKACEGPLASATLAAELDIPRSSLSRIARTLARFQRIDRSRRGLLAVGPLGLQLALSRDKFLQIEDAERVVPRPDPLQRATATSHGLSRHADSVRTIDCAAFRRSARYSIGFANAAIDTPWRTALVHSVEYGAAKYRRWIAGLSVRHAAHVASRQIEDIEALIEAGADGLIISAVSSTAIAPALERARRCGVPTVIVDRGLADCVPHVCFVTCDDETIGRTTALWLAERLKGQGTIVLLPGLAEAEPAQRRLAGANAVFGRFPELRILGTEWTNWQRATGYRIMRAYLEARGDCIDGVWCDSGLQAVGSLQAFLAHKRSHPIPPHTGGDLNLAYKLAIRHQVPLAAVDYPPAMGLRSVEVMLDILRGRTVPRRIDVATETVITRPHATVSVQPDLWADEHVRWDLPDDLILASGLGVSYDPRSFRIRYRGNRYNRSAATPPAAACT